MNNRTGPVIAVLMLTMLSSGCARTRTFLFGRGARCGAPNQASAPAYSSPSPGPCAQTRPYQPTPYQAPMRYQAPMSYQPQMPYQYQAPACSPPPQELGCGCGYEYSPPVYYGGSCPTCGEVVSDPYLSGGAIPYDGQIIGSEIISDGTVPIQPDDFEARKFDSDGNPIIWEAPLPDGARAL